MSCSESKICIHHIIGECIYDYCYKTHVCVDYYNNNKCECIEEYYAHMTKTFVINNVDEQSANALITHDHELDKKPAAHKTSYKDALTNKKDSKEESKEEDSSSNKKIELIKMIEDLKDPKNLDKVYEIIKVFLNK